MIATETEAAETFLSTEREVEGQARLLRSPDFMEGAMALLQK